VASGFENLAAFTVAAMDLSVVRLLRDAMRTADLSAAADLQLNAAGNPVLRDRYDPASSASSVQYAPRRVIQPEPRIAPRPTVTAPPRIEWEPAPGPYACGDATAKAPAAEHRSPFQPPWKVLPWPEPEPAVVKVKRYVRTVDLTGKGRMIDVML